MSKTVKKIASVALPVIGSIIAPGIGTALGSALGAGATFAPAVGGAVLGGAGGLIRGGGLKGALLGAAGGGLAGGAGSVAGAAGLGATGTSILKGALQGAGMGLTTGSPKNALLGAALGGVGGLGSSILRGATSVPGLGRAAETINWNQGGTTVLNNGSGVLGSLTKSVGSTGLSAGGGASALPGGGSMLGDVLKAGAGIYSYGQNQETSDDIRKMLEAAQGRAVNTLSPYAQAGTQALGELQAGFTPGDLTQDPGYQFQLAEGQKAIDRGLAAQGMSQSGAALKAALGYSQGLADQTCNQAHNRWFQQQTPLFNTGYNAAGGMADLYGDIGGIQALTRSQQQQSQDQLLASLLSGDSSLGRILGGSGLFA